MVTALSIALYTRFCYRQRSLVSFFLSFISSTFIFVVRFKPGLKRIWQTAVPRD